MMLSEFLADMMADFEIRPQVSGLMAAGKKWEAIRCLYEWQTPKIMRAQCDETCIDPYVLDWLSIFTPIEKDAWHSIRCSGVPLYPQYPVGNVFVDFGDPVKKIALECDGKDWHDKEKDAKRDAKLFDLGWTVFRVTGSECKRQACDLLYLRYDLYDGVIDDQQFEDAIAKWVTETSDGVIKAIASHYYGRETSDLMRRYVVSSLVAHSKFFRG